MAKAPHSSPLKPKLKRFYQTATSVEQPGGCGILLDGRLAKTPGGRGLVVPTKALAQAVSQEWQAQAAQIDFAAMPLTRLAFTTIDGVSDKAGDVRREIANYAASDLLCYRAAHPQELAARQAAAWDPVLDWLSTTHDAVFESGEGIAFLTQPPRSLQQIDNYLAHFGPFALTALHVMTTLSGSVFLALAVEGGFCSAAEAWHCAHIDEDWQARHWGSDGEAERRRGLREAEFLAAAQFLALLGGDGEDREEI